MRSALGILLAIIMLFCTAYAESTEYVILCTDTNGAPIAGVELTACTDTFCRPGLTDEAGIFAFEDTERDYVIHIDNAPEGYVFDTDAEYVLTDRTITIILEAA